MAKYRKRPVVIEAVQFLPDAPGFVMPEGVVKVDGPFPAMDHHGPTGETGYAIHTLEGTMFVGLGDWVITGVAGERYPCKDAIFQATYEPVEGEVPA